MTLSLTKNNSELTWTNHALEKMRHYGLSASRLKKILRNPEHEQKGVAPETTAVMQTTKSKSRPTEIWLMYQEENHKKKIITAWRYPGVSPKGKDLPIPEEIAKDLEASVN